MTDLRVLCEKIDKLIDNLGGYWPQEWLLPPIIEELGELSKELQKAADLHPNEKGSREKITEEFGDLLFAVLAFGQAMNIDSEAALLATLEKYHQEN
jgi:NTP pyrophosphatase (non-canonical NTP hydrolase)